MKIKVTVELEVSNGFPSESLAREECLDAITNFVDHEINVCCPIVNSSVSAEITEERKHA